MGTRAAWTRALARVVVACALLAGLFLMHGLATLDCHAATSVAGVTASPMPGMPMPGPSSAAMSHLSSTGDTDTDGTGGTGGTSKGTAGGLCVSTPPTSGGAGLMVALLLTTCVSLLGAVPRPSSTIGLGRSRRRRAPPPVAGSALLLTLCISRT